MDDEKIVSGSGMPPEDEQSDLRREKAFQAGSGKKAPSASGKTNRKAPKKKKSDLIGIIKDGILYKNPIFVQLLGMCSVLAISTSVINGLGMGLSVTFVLVFSNLIISVLRNFIPSKIRIASYIVVIAGLVTVVDMVMQAYIPALSSSLGLFIPLIVVNCIILARAESFASKNKVIPSVIDGLSCGIGYTLAIVIVSAIRELLGSGTLLGFQIMGDSFSPALLLILPAGGFIVLGSVIALFQWVMSRAENRKGGK